MPVSDDGQRVVCSEPGCEASFPNHRWGRIKGGAGWFQQQNGADWCPEHTPAWVAGWRARRNTGS